MLVQTLRTQLLRRVLDCRARYGVSVLAVEPREKPGHTFEVPDPDRRLESGDSLVIAGPAAKVASLERASLVRA